MDFSLDFLTDIGDETEGFCDFIVVLSGVKKYWGSFYSLSIVRKELECHEKKSNENGQGLFFWCTNMVIIKNMPTLEEMDRVIQDLINRDELHAALFQLRNEGDETDEQENNSIMYDFQYVLENEITDKIFGNVAFKVIFSDGKIFRGCFYTLSYVEKNLINNIYFWYPGMIVLNELTIGNIEIALNNLNTYSNLRGDVLTEFKGI